VSNSWTALEGWIKPFPRRLRNDPSLATAASATLAGWRTIFATPEPPTDIDPVAEVQAATRPLFRPSEAQRSSRLEAPTVSISAEL